MKRNALSVVQSLVFLVIICVTLANADDSYDLGWYTIDGGGDMWSSGGDFELCGTIGQPDTGMLTGNGLVLSGGFWDQSYSDCNSNGVSDDQDVAVGTSFDCNTNGIPDECDITSGTSNDVNTNVIPDECEPDCNENVVPDDWDIAAGTSHDWDTNGVPDECQAPWFRRGDSCRAHGAYEFCVDLGPCDAETSEVRLGGITRLELTMSASMDAESVTSDHAQVDCTISGYDPEITTWLADDTTVVINLWPGTLDLSCCRVTLDGMVSNRGLPATGSCWMGTIVADVNLDGAVSPADASSIRQRLGYTCLDGRLNEGNCWYDLNADCAITAADVSSVKQRLGNIAPPCP
jgi:hypothetical protein